MDESGTNAFDTASGADPFSRASLSGPYYARPKEADAPQPSRLQPSRLVGATDATVRRRSLLPVDPNILERRLQADLDALPMAAPAEPPTS